MMKYDYLIILEEGEVTWGAYSPDVPGCVAVGDTREEALEEFLAALEGHLQLMQEEGLELPKTASYAVRTTEIRHA